MGPGRVVAGGTEGTGDDMEVGRRIRNKLERILRSNLKGEITRIKSLN